MGEFDAYQKYERSNNGGREVNADIYGRIDASSLNSGFGDDTGEFVSEQRIDSGISLLPNQKPTERANYNKHRPAIHIGQYSMGAIGGERIVDIVCILITIVGLILIAINFQAVLDAIMQVLYPIIEVVIIILLLVVLGALAWSILRRRFSSFRF